MLERVWTETQGQPWLVKALCYEACFKCPQGRDRGRVITDDDILPAQEVLIQGSVVHLDQLADKLQEERVRRVIEPMLSGAPGHDISTHDYEYARDLGLIAQAWKEKIFHRSEEFEGAPVEVWGM